MVQTLDGIHKLNDADSYTVSAAQWRRVTGNYNFGDDTGAQAAYTIFTVTGDVLLSVVGLCQITLTHGGGNTIELGITGNTASLIAQMGGAVLDQYETWRDAAPEHNPGYIDLFGGARQFVIANGADIIFTIAGGDLTAGDIDFPALWMPLFPDGNVVAV